MGTHCNQSQALEMDRNHRAAMQWIWIKVDWQAGKTTFWGFPSLSRVRSQMCRERPLWCKGDWRKGICRPHRCDTQGAGDGSGGALCPTVHVCGKGVIEGGLHSWYKGGHLGTLVMLLFAPITIIHTTLHWIQHTMMASALIVNIATGI